MSLPTKNNFTRDGLTDRWVAVAGTPLTKRELEVMRYLREGMSNVEIGEALCVCKRTVDFHISNIFTRLRVHNRVKAIVAFMATDQAGMDRPTAHA